ncbi:hypothetical protein KKF34_02040 [Myxococcota bacterium]|nr:hypothetical protein [Myxococcota bacterium]MBU1380377.1 hypothetical protein [Myxococcota bacterium]MBU1495641.1 hypothetical protein [Myxococcota bacterium]
MPDYSEFFSENFHQFSNPLMHPTPLPGLNTVNFETAILRVLIVRLSPFSDVEKSATHSLLASLVRDVSEQIFIDFAFLPDQRERSILRNSKIPLLFGSQSFRSGGDFDLILVINSFLLELINLPAMMSSASIPLLNTQRDGFPLIILGGSSASLTGILHNQDGASIPDAIFYGEGDYAVKTITDTVLNLKSNHRSTVLKELAKTVPGLFVPGFNSNAHVQINPSITPLPALILLPGPQAGSAHLEISRGCPSFCSFCFESWDRKPYREATLEQIHSRAFSLKKSGIKTCEVLSFNFNCHQDIFLLHDELNRIFANTNFMSQRLDVLYNTPHLLELELASGKNSFTLGIEGISMRMRRYFAKGLDENILLPLLNTLIRSKSRELKLFYIVAGIEQSEDFNQFADFASTLKAICTKVGHKPRIIVSAGHLVTMPNTPLGKDTKVPAEADFDTAFKTLQGITVSAGFEFRQATDYESMLASRIIASNPTGSFDGIQKTAARGLLYDTVFNRDMLRTLIDSFNLDIKPDSGGKYPTIELVPRFTTVISNISAEFLDKCYAESLEFVEKQHCSVTSDVRRCDACGACKDSEQRRFLLDHTISPDKQIVSTVRKTIADKRTGPVYHALAIIPQTYSHWGSDWLTSAVLSKLCTSSTKNLHNIISVKEKYLTATYPGLSSLALYGKFSFELQCTDKPELNSTIEGDKGIKILGIFDSDPLSDCRPTLEMSLSNRLFPDSVKAFSTFLEKAGFRFVLKRSGESLIMDIPQKFLKKKLVYEASFTPEGESTLFKLIPGENLNLDDFFKTFGKNLYRQVPIKVDFNL